MEFTEYRKELKRLSRTELLELMIEQGKELDKVKRELAEARRQLEDRTFKMSKAGSIAEASLALGKVFEAAQEAADEYLKSIRTQGQCSDEDWERILDEAIAKREEDDNRNRKGKRRHRRARKSMKITARPVMTGQEQTEEAEIAEAEMQAETQTTEARYSEAAEATVESTYYNDEETEAGAVTVTEEAGETYEETPEATEITETAEGSEDHHNEDTKADAVTVIEEATDETYKEASIEPYEEPPIATYEEAPTATEITETAEGSDAEEAEAEGEVIERNAGSGIE